MSDCEESVTQLAKTCDCGFSLKPDSLSDDQLLDLRSLCVYIKLSEVVAANILGEIVSILLIQDQRLETAVH